MIVRTYIPIGNRDASLLSMVCLALAINCTHIRECLLAGRPKRQGPLRACGGQATVQSELDGVTRNRSIYARTFFPCRLSALCVLRNRRQSYSNTSSTATRRGTIDGRDASLLFTVELYKKLPRNSNNISTHSTEPGPGSIIIRWKNLYYILRIFFMSLSTS